MLKSIKTDIGKLFDKLITMYNSNLNVIDFIDQSIEMDTHNHPTRIPKLSTCKAIVLISSFGDKYCSSNIMQNVGVLGLT